MACEPFDCDECGQRHARCKEHSIRCPSCDWSGGNTAVDQPCIQCETPCIIRPCNKWPRKGIAVCDSHGGSAPQVIHAAEARELESEARKLLGVDGYEPITDPYTALAELAGEVVKLKDVLRQKVEELTTLRSFGGESGEQIDIHMAAYERALDRAEKILSGMARLDLDERIARVQSRINAEGAARIVGAMNGALDAANVPDAMREVILREFGARLRSDSRPGSKPTLNR